MINVIRPKEVPASLQSQEIRDYLEALANHRDDPEHFSKPEKPPAAYRNSDVLKAFDRCFFSKCYLTEQKFATSWVLDVEHFEPRKEKPELAYEWTNLFPCEHRANMVKPRNTPKGGYLNPCDPYDDVEVEIVYEMYPSGRGMTFKTRQLNNIKAFNTAQLLNDVHNGKNSDKDSIESTKHLKSEIKKKFDEVHYLIQKWRDADDSSIKHKIENNLRNLLSRRSSFTALLRSVPAVKLFVPKDLLD